MSQKTDLQSNNTDLQSILNTINNLPEVGSGGGSGDVSVETCTFITINCLCNSFVTIIGLSKITEEHITAGRIINCTILNAYNTTSYCCGIFAITAAAGEAASYTYTGDSIGGGN